MQDKEWFKWLRTLGEIALIAAGIWACIRLLGMFGGGGG